MRNASRSFGAKMDLSVSGNGSAQGDRAAQGRDGTPGVEAVEGIGRQANGGPPRPSGERSTPPGQDSPLAGSPQRKAAGGMASTAGGSSAGGAPGSRRAPLVGEQRAGDVPTAPRPCVYGPAPKQLDGEQAHGQVRARVAFGFAVKAC